MWTWVGSGRWVVLFAAVSVGAVSGCKASGRTDYSQSPDSGAVAPAAKIDTSLSRSMRDSTPGGPQRTGKPGVAGDTLSTRGRPVGTGVRPADPAKKKP